MANHIRKDGGVDRRFKNNSGGSAPSGCAGILALLIAPILLLLSIL